MLDASRRLTCHSTGIVSPCPAAVGVAAWPQKLGRWRSCRCARNGTAVTQPSLLARLEEVWGGEGTPPMIYTKRPGACSAMPLLT